MTTSAKATNLMQTLGEPVWRAFARDLWENTAACLQGVLRQSLVSPELMFKTLVEVGNYYRAGLVRDAACF